MREAVVIVLMRHGRVLLIRRARTVPRAGVWSPPTGRIEAGESAAQAVVREAREELGLEVRPIAQAWTSVTDDGRFRLLWWLAESDAGTITPDPQEVAEWRWIAPADFDAVQPVFESHRPFFAEVLPGL
ncbi:MAG TPA: NUDIX domain-containing protein [Xanthomonadaceae bacterium]|nr:NUDIX domain-containing protein [Xanthomonadaceae bacterium]